MSEAIADPDLVAGLQADRQAGFDALYRSYAERLYAYAVTVLRDRDAAQDAAHEALLSAVANIERLRDPQRLRPWLFAITRNTCLTALNDSRRLVHDDEALDTAVHEEDPAAGASAADAGEIVRTAMNALAPADREVLALALRGDLDAGAVAEAMGSTQATARARISRAKGALTESVLGLVLARQPQRECAGLTEVLREYTGEWTPLLRKRVAKHVRTCPQCSEDGNRRAVSYVSAFVLPVVLVLPLGARARADELLANLDLSAAAGAGAWAPSGFPKPVSVSAGLSARRLLPVAAGVAVVSALVLTTVVATSSAESGGPAQGPSPEPTAESVQQAGDPSAAASQSPDRAGTDRAGTDSGTPTPGTIDSPRDDGTDTTAEPGATDRRNTNDRDKDQTGDRGNDPGADGRDDPATDEGIDTGTPGTPDPGTPDPDPPKSDPPKSDPPNPDPPKSDPPSDPKDDGRPTRNPTNEETKGSDGTSPNDVPPDPGDGPTRDPGRPTRDQPSDVVVR